MATSTTNYALQKPAVGSATDQDLWGGELNGDLDSIDTLLRAGITIAVQSSQTTGFTASASISVKKLYPCDATSGAFAATLPVAATAGNGAVVYFKKTDSSAHAITITAGGSDTIDGASTYSLNGQYGITGMISDGTSNWQVITSSIYGLAALSSPAFTGTPTAPTAASTVSNTQIATTAQAASQPGSAKAYVDFTVSGGVCTIVSSFNVTSVTYNSTGNYTVNFTSNLTDNKYIPVATSMVSGASPTFFETTRAIGSFVLAIYSAGTLTPIDVGEVGVVVFR